MYGILPKICEVDSAISPSHQERIIESHPELIFQRLNKGSPLPSKKSGEGRALRRGLLEEDGFAALEAWIASLRGTGAKVDDLFDACGCAIAARDSIDKVPAQPLLDPRGLRMEIHY
jgi:predicted RNase H-like nuclease